MSDAPVRVAHCIHGLGLGGAQQVIKFIAARGDRKAFRHFVYSCEDGVFRQPVEATGATVRIVKRRIPKLDPLWVLGLARAMRADEIDLVHTHLFGDSLHGYLAARAAGGLRVIMTLHNGTSAHSRIQQHGYRWLIRRATRTVACTPSAARSFGGLVGGEIPTITNGIDPPRFSPLDPDRRAEILRDLKIPPNSLVIGTVGRMVEQKGYAYLIDAFARLDRVCDRARLLMLGDGPLRNDLQRRACERGIGSRVHFAGLRTDVAQLLQVFDVIVFSSLYEGLSIALLEAMATARCIVGTTAAGIADAVADGREAILVPVADAQRLADAIALALSRDELRQRLGRAAQLRFREEFTAERMVAKYERLYREALATTVAAETMPAVATRGDLAAGTPEGES